MTSRTPKSDSSAVLNLLHPTHTSSILPHLIPCLAQQPNLDLLLAFTSSFAQLPLEKILGPYRFPSLLPSLLSPVFLGKLFCFFSLSPALTTPAVLFCSHFSPSSHSALPELFRTSSKQQDNIQKQLSAIHLSPTLDLDIVASLPLSTSNHLLCFLTLSSVSQFLSSYL